MAKKKKQQKGKVSSKRQSKLERAKHGIGLIYYIIMLIFAVSLFLTFTIVWMKVWPLLEKLDEITNNTTSMPSIIFSFLTYFIKTSIIIF